MSADDHLALTSRLFPTEVNTTPAVNRPGVSNRGVFRDILEGNGTPAPRSSLLTEKQQAFIGEFVRRQMEVLQNSNVTVALPSWSQENLWSTPIDLSTQLTVGAAVTTYTNALSYTVEPGRWAVIKGYGVDVTAPAGYTYNGSLLWRITVNGIPVQSLFDWGNHRGSVIQPRKTHIILREGWVVRFDVRRAVASALSDTINMAMVGWTWRPRHNFEGTEVGTTAF